MADMSPSERSLQQRALAAATAEGEALEREAEERQAREKSQRRERERDLIDGAVERLAAILGHRTRRSAWHIRRAKKYDEEGHWTLEPLAHTILMGIEIHTYPGHGPKLFIGAWRDAWLNAYPTEMTLESFGRALEQRKEIAE